MAHSPAEGAGSLREKKILLIDDDASTRLLLERVLASAGATVMDASSVVEALALMKKSLPDLILLDLNMPEHNGFQFLQLRAKHPQLKKIPVIVLSGETNSRRVGLALALGADHFQEKPFRSHLILQKIGYVLFEGDPFVHVFERDARPEAEVEIVASVVAHAPERLEILTNTQFAPQHAVKIRIDGYEARGGGVLVGKARTRRSRGAEEATVQTIDLIGLSPDERKRFAAWRSES